MSSSGAWVSGPPTSRLRHDRAFFVAAAGSFAFSVTAGMDLDSTRLFVVALLSVSVSRRAQALLYKRFPVGHRGMLWWVKDYLLSLGLLGLNLHGVP